MSENYSHRAHDFDYFKLYSNQIREINIPLK